MFGLLLPVTKKNVMLLTEIHNLKIRLKRALKIKNVVKFIYIHIYDTLIKNTVM